MAEYVNVKKEKAGKTSGKEKAQRKSGTGLKDRPGKEETQKPKKQEPQPRGGNFEGPREGGLELRGGDSQAKTQEPQPRGVQIEEPQPRGDHLRGRKKNTADKQEPQPRGDQFQDPQPRGVQPRGRQNGDRSAGRQFFKGSSEQRQ